MLLLSLACLGFTTCTTKDSDNQEYQWDYTISFDWKFAKGDQEAAMNVAFEDSDWEKVDLPHDWAISGPFAPLKSPGNTGKLPWQERAGTAKVLI